MVDLGIVKPGTTIYIPFASFAGSTGASITLTGLAVTDIEVYKDGGTTQRASDNGYTLLDTDGIDFDGITGIHGFSISLADNSTAGFYAAGSDYFVVISSVTIDSQTVNFVAARFRIGYPSSILDTTIATLASQTSFTLTAGPAEDDALNGMWVVIHDVASAVQLGYAVILDYTGSTKTVTLAAGTTFTAAATDNISVLGPMPLQPTTMGRTLQVESDGMAHVDLKEWLGTAPLSLSSQQVQAVVPNTQKVDVETIKTRAVSAAGAITVGAFVGQDTAAIGVNVSGHVSRVVLADTVTTLTNLPAITANWLTAAGIADGAIDRAAFAADTGLQTIRSNTAQTGAAGSITLDASASATTDFYKFAVVYLTGGTGAGQERLITAYDGTTKVATVAPNWATNPDSTTTFAIRPWSSVNVEAWREAIPNTAVAGRIDVTVGAMQTNVLTSTVTSANYISEIEAAVRTGAGLASANLDTQLAALPASVWTSGTRTLTAATNITSTGGTTVPQTGDNFARLGAPAGASVSADIAAKQATFTVSTGVTFPTNFGSLSIDANGRAKIQSGVPTNTALANFEFFMVDSTDHVSGKTGLTVTATRSIDGAAFAACSNSVTEVANGVYKINLAAADLNGSTITLKFTATGADARIIEIVTTP